MKKSFWAWLKSIFKPSKPKKKFKKKPINQNKIFLTSKTKVKANRIYRKFLAEFKRKHKRKPTKKDLLGIIVKTSHYTFPVKGRNVRTWTKGKRGHMNRQKVRKYLAEKYKMTENFIMKQAT